MVWRSFSNLKIKLSLKVKDKDQQIIRRFYKNELQETNQKEFRVGKVIKRKGDELYDKWKGYDNSFNIWIDKKYIVL